jgi:hypothetical protein
MRLLAKSPADRPASARDVAAALEAIERRLADRARRQALRRFVGVGAIVLLLGILGVAAFSWVRWGGSPASGSQTSTPERKAERPPQGDPVQATPTAVPSKLYVLAIGINAYWRDDLRLEYAVHDAEEIVHLFQDPDRQLPNLRVGAARLVTDGAATRQGIRDGLHWLQERVQPGDVAVVYYCGQGERFRQRFALIAVDYDDARVAETTLSVDELRQELVQLPGRVLVLLDASHAGAIGWPPDTASHSPDDGKRGVLFLGASTAGQKAQDLQEEGHGLFTHVVLQGLRGEADYSKDHQIGSAELEHYIKENVPKLADNQQDPCVDRPYGFLPFDLVRVPQR